MRRLLLLVAVLVFVDTMLFAALTPLLPHFAHEFGLSKTRAGALVAAYAAGALIGGLPGGFAAARLGRTARGDRRPDGDGARERRLRARRRLLDALRRAPAPGRRQRVHVGGRVRLAARRGAARPARRADRQRDGRGDLRRAVRAGDRRGGRARRSRRHLQRARRARRPFSSCGRCGSTARRPASSPRARRSCARFATVSSRAGSR